MTKSRNPEKENYLVIFIRLMRLFCLENKYGLELKMNPVFAILPIYGVLFTQTICAILLI